MLKRTAFEQIYNRHVGHILAYFQRRLPDSLAPDATAEVFIVVWRRFDDRPDDDATLPWLYTIAHNVLRNAERGSRRRYRLESRVQRMHRASAIDVSADEPVIRQAERERVVDAIRRLPAKDREIIRLVEWDGLDRSTVAEMFGISRNAIDQRMSRAYDKLRRLLDIDVAQGTAMRGSRR